MTTIASLGLQIDSGDAVEAKDNLERLAEAGAKAEKSADSMATGFKKAASEAAGLATAEARVAETTEEAMERLTAMAKASLDASEYHKSLAASLTSTSTAMGSASSAATDWSAYQAEINARGRTLLETEERVAESARQAAMALGVQGDGLQTLLGKINPAVAALDKLDKQQEDLQKYRNAGLLDADTFKEYNARIESSRQKLGEFSEGMHQAGISTGQTQAALRQLPAQFTDIFTSLAGGQNPLLVLIQQGGQIVDSFGGIGPTLDVLGEKIRSMLGIGGGIGSIGDALGAIGEGGKAAAEGADAAGESLGGMAEGANTAADAAKNAKEAADAVGSATPPVTLGIGLLVGAAVAATAALGTLIYGYSQGSNEADEYNKSLILTGNYAGTSADALGDMARRVSDVNGTTGQAADVLAKLASAGKFAGESFELIANAAVAMEDATGRSVDATIAEFVKIADGPVKAAKALDSQYHFLTATIYSQIVALEKQGDTIGAANLLTTTYADTIKERAGEITENLGYIEAAWKGVKDAAAGALDGVLNVGREKTLLQQIEELETKLASPLSYQAVPIAFDDNPDLMKQGSTRAEDEAKLQTLRLFRKEQELTAKAAGEERRAQEAAVLGMEKVDAFEKSSRTNAQKRADALKEYEKSLDAIRKKNPDDERLSPDRIAKVRANINEQFKDPKARAGEVDLTTYNDQKNSLNAILAEYKNFEKELDAAQKAGLISQESYAAQRAAIIEQQKAEVTNAYEAEIKSLEEAKGRSSTSAQQRIQLDQKIADARANMVKAQKDADSELAVLASNEEGRLRKQAQAVQTYTSALDQQVQALHKQGQRSAEGLGLGDRQRSLQDQQNGITDRINQQRLDLANQYGDGSRGMSLDEYNQKLAALSKTERDLQETTVANYDQMTQAQGDWRNGASSAFQNYLEQARDVAGQTRTLFTNAFSSMEDAVVNFAMTGKFSFADFTKSVLADMARIATQRAIAGIAGSILGSVAGAYFTPGGQTVSTSGFSEGGFVPNAKGGVYDSPSLSKFSNQVHDTPQFFAFAKGAGVFGEAGPEAIMPLTRTPDGNLGVRAVSSGSGGGTSISINAPVSISIPDRSDEGLTLDQTLLQQNMQKQVQVAAEKAVADSWRPGGVSYRNTQGRR